MTVMFPADIKIVSVYSMQGLRQMEKYFKNTNLVNLDLSSLPVGVYAMIAMDNNGKLYGFKLFR